MGILKNYSTIGRARCKDALDISNALSAVERPLVVMSFATDAEFDQHILEMSRRNWAKCDACSLACSRDGDALYGDGEAGSELLIICGAPQKGDHDSGHLISGDPGKLLKRICDKAGFPSVFITSIVACATPHNRTPKSREREACRPRIKGIFDAVKPSGVLLLGPVAGSLTSSKRSTGVLTRKLWGDYLDSRFGLKAVAIETHPMVILSQSSKEKRAMTKGLYDTVSRLRRLCG